MDISPKVMKNRSKPSPSIVDWVNLFGRLVVENKKKRHTLICLALHHASLYDRIRRSEQKCKVALEVLSYHASCTDEEYERLKSFALPQKIPHIEQFDFSPWSVSNDMKPLYVLYMFLDLTQMNPLTNNR